jgi:excisionase family DNA binding protein
MRVAHIVTVMHETPDDAPDAYMTPAEVCALLNISERTLWRYQDDGHIAAVRLPSGHRRFRRADVEALIAA